MSKSEIQKPNFFIIGFPRSGTSSMAEYLRSHPDIYFSRPKEPGYFHRIGQDDCPFESDEEYLETCFYGTRGKNFKAIGEGSVSYIYSKKAIKKILEFNPEAKFIVMIRNPVDIAYSGYIQRQFNKKINDPSESFINHWKAQKSDLRDISKAGKYMKKLYSILPKQKVLIIIFDDFSNNTKNEYRKVLNFLNVNYKGKKEFPVINKSKVAKSKFIKKIIDFLAKTKRSLITKRSWGVLGNIRNIISKNVEKKKLPKEFRKKLTDYFEGDIKKLSKLINKDLSHWLNNE